MMNLYKVTFTDGTHAEINGQSPEEAIRNAQRAHSKAVASVILEKTIQDKPASTFESLRKGGANF